MSSHAGIHGGGDPRQVAELKSTLQDRKNWWGNGAVPPPVRLMGGTYYLPSIAWHGPFMAPLIEGPDGALTGTPGAPANDRTRMLLLAHFQRLYDFINTLSFHNAVWDAGTRFGMDLRARFACASRLTG